MNFTRSSLGLNSGLFSKKQTKLSLHGETEWLTSNCNLCYGSIQSACSCRFWICSLFHPIRNLSCESQRGFYIPTPDVLLVCEPRSMWTRLIQPQSTLSRDLEVINCLCRFVASEATKWTSDEIWKESTEMDDSYVFLPREIWTMWVQFGQRKQLLSAICNNVEEFYWLFNAALVSGFLLLFLIFFSCRVTD
jgi:hypothetical protein